MKGLTEKITTKYLVTEIELTENQADNLVLQALATQLKEPEGIPERVQRALAEVLVWYAPDQIDDTDFRHHVQ